MDINCFAGHWPYRKLRHGSFADLVRQHERLGVQGGLVSALESVFYHDPLEGDQDFAPQLAGTPYRLALSVNPQLPVTPDQLAAADRLGARAIRLYPTVHGYGFDLPELDSLCAEAAGRGLPVLIQMRMEDIRLTYLHGYTQPDAAALGRLIERHPETTFALCAGYYSELTKLERLFHARKNLYCDISGLKDGLFALDELAARLPVSQIVYGSQAPLYVQTCSWLLIETSKLSPEDQAAILNGNARRMIS